MRKISFLVIVLATLSSLNSCKKEGCTDPEATNFDAEAKINDASCIYKTSPLEVPETYSFTRDGKSSVNISGQTIRMDMLSEMMAYLKTANIPGVHLDLDKLNNMFRNEGNPFKASKLKNTDKQLRSKTVNGDQVFVLYYDNTLRAASESSKLTRSRKYEAKDGTSGVMKYGGSSYLYYKTGANMIQKFEKGIMGGLFYFQISQVYLSDERMAADNTTFLEGKNYTQLEGYWDEAFGYFTDAPDFPTNGTDRFWGKVFNDRDAELGCNKTIMDAYKKGRTAIVNRNLKLRDEQIEIITKEFEKVILSSAIFYLNEAKNNLSNDVIRNNSMSIATQFIEAIKFGKNPSISRAETINIIGNIGVNYYKITKQKIDETLAVLTQKLEAL